MATPEQLAEEKKKRVMDAVALKKPDRIPMFLPFCSVGAEWAGITAQEAFNDMDKWTEINKNLMVKYQPDLYIGLYAFAMKANEIAGTRNYNWPGHGLPPTSSYQFVEGEYMKADEYDLLLSNPGDFLFRTYLSRVYGNLEGLSYMPPMISLLSYGGLFNAFANPAVLESLETIVASARESSKHWMHIISYPSKMYELGFPMIMGFGSQAPFDVISDYLRGLKGSTLDIFRHPDKLQKVQDLLLPYLIETSVSMGKMMGTPLSFIALHRGSDGFMSLKQFETFYWPGLKKLLMAMIDVDLIPFVFWEGSWDQRLEYLNELPKGKVVGWFDRSNIFKVKEVIGDRMCIVGDMPISLLQTGTPDLVRAYAKKLIDVVGKDGGFIMAPQTQLDNGKEELVKAWVDFTREYGVYR